MERTNEQLENKKSWAEMTEEERQAVRESWKQKLPEKYDVFCIGDFFPEKPVFIPGNLYVSGDVSETCAAISILISENFIVKGNVDAGTVSVGGHFIVDGSIDSCTDISVIGDFICDNDVDAMDITVGGNFIVDGVVEGCAISVHKSFDCYDVGSTEDIYSTDYVCRTYKKQN